MVIYCDDSGDITAQEADKKAIDQLKVEIKQMADQSICSDEYQCYSIGVGAKPCGGYWEYIVYSGSIDVSNFMHKIDKVNALEEKYNTKYNIQSDCYMTMPPSSIDCVDGKCTPVYD